MKLKPKKDLLQEKIWTNLKQKKKVDELLRLQSHFIDVVDPEVSPVFYLKFFKLIADELMKKTEPSVCSCHVYAF